MRLILIIGLFLTAMVLQMLGNSETCTQGGIDGFVVGAILSLPLLLLVGVLQTINLIKHQIAVLEASVIVLSTGAFLILTFNIWSAILIHGTPCGEPYTVPGQSLQPTFVLFSYAVVPAAILMVSIVSIGLAFSSKGFRSNG